MGCAGSKLENEDTVRRCKERCRLMKAAVHARHHLAAAHSDYSRSLRLTGSALVSFAAGERFSVSDHPPAVIFHSSASTRPATFTPPPPPPPPASSSPSVRPPPAPLSTSSSHRHQKPPPPPFPRRRKPIKVPHILSESSFPSSPLNHDFFTYNARSTSTYASTPSQSQASSVWNWDNFYPPPSPPDSEYFKHLSNEKKNENQREVYSDDDEDHHHVNVNADSYDKASKFSSKSDVMEVLQNPFETKKFDDRVSYALYDPREMKNPRVTNKGSKWESETEGEREEVQCSEWGDHDNISSTSISSYEDDEGDFNSRSDLDAKSNYESVKGDNVVGDGMKKKNMGSKFSSKLGKISSEDDDSWDNDNFQGVNSERRMVVRHRDLMEIVSSLKEYFDEAASAGEHVSDMLEASRDQLDRSFKQLRKRIYHSSGILSTLSSSWTSKPPLTVKYQLEPHSIEHSGGDKSLCSTMDRLLAWEKKLYQEVRAREVVKIEHEKKLSALQSQEYRGANEAMLDKTKASIQRLQSLILVTSQAASTTSSAIVDLRDSNLIPQLVELCHGFMYMWRSMHQCHEMQNDVVQQVRGLVNRSLELESTSEMHRQATRDLEFAVSAWHSSFSSVIKFHRDFICSIYGWFKLTLIPVNASDGETKQHLEQVFTFVEEWKLGLDRVPDTVASEAIKSFNNIIRSISMKQSEEMKIKKRTDTASKVLEKKALSLRTIEKKYYKSYSMVGIAPPDVGGSDHSHILDARDPLAEKKAELTMYRRRVEDEMAKHSKAVEVTRAMTLNNIQTGLPGVFQAMSSFSALVTEALETVCKRSYAI